MTRAQKSWLLPPLALCTALGILLGRSSGSLLFGLLGLLAALPACFLLRGRLRFAAILALFLALGDVCGYAAWHPALPEKGACRVSGVVSGEIRTQASGRIRTTLSDVKLNGEPFSAGLYWSFYAEEVPPDLQPGRLVTFEASLYHPSGPSNPGGYDFREDLLRQGITAGVYGAKELQISDPDFFSFQGWTAGIRHSLQQKLLSALGEGAGGYAATMLLSSRSLISQEDRSAFSRLGIAHVLSVSGFHVGLLVSVLAFLFRLLRLPQRLRLVLYAVLLGFYCALCGFSQPVIRASLLVLLALRGRILSRPRSALHLLSAAFTLMLLISPVQLTGLSFQLSFGAMLGISVITPFLYSLWSPRSRRVDRVWNGLCAGLGAQLGILLPELYAFQELPLLGLLVNLPVIFVASGLILLYWIVLFTLPVPLLSPMLCEAAGFLTRHLLSAIRFLGSVPGITVWTRASDLWTALGVVLLFIVLCGLLRLRPRHRLAAGGAALALIVLSLLPRPHTATEYIQFSVGSADAALLWDRDRVTVIDTGYDDGAVSDFLRRRQLTPDEVILTHLHSDHAGGLQSLREDRIPVSVIYLPAGAEMADIQPEILFLLEEYSEEGTEIRTLSAGDRLTFPSGEAKVLWPEKGRVRSLQDANDYSLVLRMDLLGTSLLQTGDLSGTYEMYAAAPSDLLKLAHHGSASSTSPDFLSAVSPRCALLSCDDEERHAAVAERLGDIPLYSTALGGALTVRFSPSAWTIETFLPPSEDD